MIEEFNEYLLSISDIAKREKFANFLNKIYDKFPQLQPRISWNMPVFTNNSTYIIGISAFKEHFSIAPEPKTIEKFADNIIKAGYKSTKGLFKVKWTDEISYELIFEIIEFNILDKKDCKTFWRK